MPYDNEVFRSGEREISNASRLSYESRREAGLLFKQTKHFRGYPFAIFEGFLPSPTSNSGKRDELLATIMNDTNDEIVMLVQTCAVLNCANVQTTEIAPPAALNKTRAAKGKAPFFSYKVLTLTDPRSSIRSAEADGTHASPRTHLRRGHIRRLSERTVWIRPALVGNHGSIRKDYRLAPATGRMS